MPAKQKPKGRCEHKHYRPRIGYKQLQAAADAEAAKELVHSSIAEYLVSVSFTLYIVWGKYQNSIDGCIVVL